MTGGLDLAVILQKENLLGLVGVMEHLGYRPKAPVNPKDLSDPGVRESWKKDKGRKVFTFFHPKKPFAEVDILIDEPIDFNGIWERRVECSTGNVSIPTASIEDLITMKRKPGRDKDLSDIAALNRIRALKEKEK
jgi:hypothetical protein